MRIEMLLTYDFDPATGEMTPVSCKLVSEKEAKSTSKSKTSSTSKKSEENIPETGILLESNKLILSEEAASLLGVEADDRIAITYEKKGRFLLPVIGVDEKKGNKLTKSNTISYRGKAHDELARYGTSFTMEPTKNGKFFLIGENEVISPEPVAAPKGIVVNEEDSSVDMPFKINLDDTKAKEITNFNFNDINLS